MTYSQYSKPSCVRMSIVLATTLVAGLLFMSMRVARNAVQAQSCLVTDPFVRPIPPAGTPPPKGQPFVDPTFCQTLMRVTDGTDGTHCNVYYSYWPTFNVDSTRFIIACDLVPKLYEFDPDGFHFTAKGNLFAPGALNLTTEGAIWSTSDRLRLYAHEGPRLWAFDVDTKTYTPIKDFSAEVNSGDYLWQMSKSLDDDVFAFTVRNSSDIARGYIAWKKSSNTILRKNLQLSSLDEVQVDKSGKYLAVKAEFSSGVNFETQDLQTASSSTQLTRGYPDYGPGHSDNGVETVIGYEDTNNRFLKRSLHPDQAHSFSTVFDLHDWSQASHLSMLADNEGWCVISNFTNVATDADQSGNAFRQEIFQVSTDGNQSVRRLAHHHSIYFAYEDTPRANISRDGRFIAFTSNWNDQTRRDVYIIRVPPLSGCTFTIAPTSQSFGSGSGTDTIAVTSSGGNCAWTATTSDGWISITSGATGMGSGTVGYSILANTGAARNGSITVAGQTFSVSQAGAAAGVQNVIWTHPANCTVNGNSVVKNGGGAGSCDGGAYSQQTITSGNGYLEFTASEANKFRFGALTTMTTTNNYLALDFAIDFTIGAQAEVRENGSWMTSVGFVANNVFRISVESGVVKYYKNGTVFYTSTKTPSFPLYANALLCDTSSTITNAVMLLPSCVYTIAPTSQSFGSGSGTGTIAVTPSINTCSWTASTSDSWISITSGASGMGSGTVGYSVLANTGAARNGSITAAGQTFSVSQAGASAGVQNVIWTHPANCTVNGNSVVKNGGGAGSCDGGAYSQQTITSGNGYLEFTASEANKFRFGALTTMTTTNNYLALDFAIDFTIGAQAEVRENGSWMTSVGFVANNVFRISVESGVVKYYKNGTVFYTSTKTPSFPLYANALLCDTSSTISNAVMQLPSCVYSIAPTSESFGSGSGTGTIAVTTNINTCSWTATTGDSWISITSGAPGMGSGTVGYSILANTGAARNGSITVAGQTFSISQGGVDSGEQNVIWTHPANCTVNGNSVVKNGGGAGSCDGGAYSQQTITSGNGYLEFTASEANKFRFGALTTMTTTNNYLALDFAIDFTIGAQAEVRENGSWMTSVGFVANNVFRISVESGVVKYYKNGTVFYTSTKTPSFPLYANALLCDTSSTITNAVMLLPSCVYTIAPTSQSFGSGSGTGTIAVTPSINTCSWTASTSDSWISITSGASGMGSGTVGYSVLANTGAARNGSITAAGQTFSVSQAGASAGVQNVIWTHPANCTVNGNSVVKNGGGAGSCDGGAYSQQTITSGNGYLEFTASEANKFRFGALTTMTTTNNYLALDFAIDFTIGAQAEVRENGSWMTSVGFVANNVFRISVESGVVKYYKNGTVFYTSTKTPSFPLYANALLCDTSSTITNAVMMLPSCVTIAPNHQSFASSAGTGAINVNASSGCSWTATKTDSWITITSSASGSGNGTVSYSVTANANSTIRSGVITVNNQAFTVYQGITFADVPTSDPFYNDIGRLSSRAVTLGCGGGNYCPNDSVSRQAMAAFLMRALGEFSPPTPASQRFADVPSSNVFYSFIDRIAALNITVGCGGSNYCPGDPVTREQMAAFILRALGEFSPPTPPAQRFNDVPSSSGFYNFIDRVAVLQITLGCSQSPPLYCPGDPVTRAQMAAFLVRAFNL